jgi:hypothetical protein
MNLNLSERRGAARLMSAWELYAEVQRFERDEGLRNDGRRRRKGDDVSNRTHRGRTTEGAVLEMGMRSRVMMVMMRGHLHWVGRGARFQKERRSARRHETDGYISPKQEDYQQQAGE